MLKQGLFLSLCLCFSSQADVFKFEIPSSSTLTHMNSEESPYGILFEGRAEVSVTYQFKYDEHSRYGSPYILFVRPDALSLKSLPYLTERNYPERAEDIFIHNVEESAYLLLNPEQAKAYISGATKHFSGKAVIEISDLFASYSCDSVSFTAKVKQSNKILLPATDKLTIVRQGC